MSMTTIIIISLLVLNLSLTLIMFWILHSVLEATKSLQDSENILKKVLDINNQLIEKYNKCLDNVYKRETTIHDNVTETYGAITEAYNKMYEQYKLICETHTKLLECWKGCEERYSQSYEQFKHCSEKLKEISFQITDLANMLTEDEYTLTLHEACDTVCLECPYEDCKNGLKYEDKMLDCPIWKIKSNQREIEAELEETDEFLRWKARDEWTDDDYRDAVNTHPEDNQEGAEDDK